MPSGSYTFWNDAYSVVVNWNYDSDKKQLTVSGTVAGKPMTSAVLTKQNNTGSISGSSGSTSATVSLIANFTALQLEMAADEINPNRSGNQNSPF